MTTFGNFDMEYMMRGRMVDLPTFDTYNVQYQPPTSALQYQSTAHYPATLLQHCGSLSPDGDGSPSFDNDHTQRPQIHAPRSSAAATPSPYFWESGGISEGTFERTACAAASTATAGIPSSVVQWHLDYLQPPELLLQASTVDPPPQADPFQMSPACTTQGMESHLATQMPPADPYIPNQLVYPFRHNFIPGCPVPSVGTIVNHSSIHLAAHQPVPPECQSTYSTLAGHVEFLEKLRLEDSTNLSWNGSGTSPSSITLHSQPLSASSSSSNKRQRSPSTSIPYDSASFPNHRTSIGGMAASPDVRSPTQLTVMEGDFSRGLNGLNFAKRARLGDSFDSSLSQPPPPSPVVTSESTSVPSAVTIEEAPPATKHPKNVKEPRKPSLACLFCRERKIGCGRPPEGSKDMTCNQCARRKFVCVYMAEKPPRVRRRPTKAKLPTI